jgi:hypothetical protein
MKRKNGQKIWLKTCSLLMAGVFLFTQVAYARHYESSDALDDFFKNDLGDALKTAAIVVACNVIGAGVGTALGLSTTTIIVGSLAGQLTSLGCQAGGMDARQAAWIGGAVGGIAGGITAGIESAGTSAGTSAATSSVDAYGSQVFYSAEAGIVSGGGSASTESMVTSAAIAGGQSAVETTAVDTTTNAFITVCSNIGKDMTAAFTNTAANPNMVTNTWTNMAIGGTVGMAMGEAGYQVSQTDWGQTWGQVVMAAAAPLATFGVAQGVQWVGPSIGLNYTAAPSWEAAGRAAGAAALEYGAIALAKELTKDRSEETQALAVMAAGTIGGFAGTSLQYGNFKENWGKYLASNAVEYGASYAIDKAMGESKTYDQMFLKSLATYAVAGLGAAVISGGISAYKGGTFSDGFSGYFANFTNKDPRQNTCPTFGIPQPPTNTLGIGNYALKTINFYGLNNENIMEAGKIYGGNITYDYAVLANMSQGLQNDAAGTLARTISGISLDKEKTRDGRGVSVDARPDTIQVDMPDLGIRPQR